MNPSDKDFTYLIKTYAIIDFCVPRISVDLIKVSNIGSIHISDHAPIFMEIHIKNPNSQRWNWQCNRSILSDPEFCSMARRELQMFVDVNDNVDTDSSNLWETTKEFLRGIMISHCSAKEKKMMKEQRRLELQLFELELEYKCTMSVASWDRVLIARTALNTLLSQKAEKALYLQRLKLYEYGNQAGCYLANLIITGLPITPLLKLEIRMVKECILQKKSLRYLRNSIHLYICQRIQIQRIK